MSVVVGLYALELLACGLAVLLAAAHAAASYFPSVILLHSRLLHPPSVASGTPSR